MDADKTAGGFLWIGEAEVVRLMSLRQAIEALEQVLVLEASGAAQNMVKTHVVWGRGNTLHAIGATLPGDGFAGTKTWAYTAGGASPLLILFDSTTGALKAVVEAFALGQLRTGGISGVATRWLAAPDADELAVVGTGKQMLAQVAAVAAVRPLRRVRVFSPSPEHRTQAGEQLRALLDCSVAETTSVETCVTDAPIVTLVTRATQPFLTARMVARGAHVNAVGAITPERAEFADDLFDRCGRVVVDSPAAVRKLSREFIDRYGEDEAAWQTVTPLSAIVASRTTRPAETDVTLFKAMGMGLSDLALGIAVYRRAVEEGVGRSLPRPLSVRPRL
jgi:ornithine cyclodeaminase/alanine dehydrogenase-like protein (mu-crystallin family)